ncbi:hypothetical protein Acr_22g0006510 [Actinidia rufa]|uniref:Uncharacterized protein n=1 Tax=Actinidia rufa TaxID=165716 RepID=A0A7J0GKC0_9ERIC|nr:hypothetical protein Acr_22g0006510 [Actinidia rufa]
MHNERCQDHGTQGGKSYAALVAAGGPAVVAMATGSACRIQRDDCCACSFRRCVGTSISIRATATLTSAMTPTSATSATSVKIASVSYSIFTTVMSRGETPTDWGKETLGGMGREGWGGRGHFAGETDSEKE